MSSKLPVISGKQLVKMMHSLGYVVVRQRGSHITMRLETNIGVHSITVPNHEEIAKGTLNDILNKVSIWTQKSNESLIALLNR